MRIEDVNLDIRRGEIPGLVGESGSGKTTLGRALLRLVEPTAGKVIFNGEDVMDANENTLRDLRRRKHGCRPRGREVDGGPGKQISHMVMPVVTLALLPMAYLTRMMRSTMLEVINEVSRVVYIHALRNAMIPYVTITALQIGNLIAGSMVVESVLAWPGLGLLLHSIRTLDISVVAASRSFVAALFVVLNLSADTCYITR